MLKNIGQFVQTGSGQTWGETLRQEGFFCAGATKRQRWLQQQQRVLLRVRQPAAAGAGAQRDRGGGGGRRRRRQQLGRGARPACRRGRHVDALPLSGRSGTRAPTGHRYGQLPFLRCLVLKLKTTLLPRQARDKHRERKFNKKGPCLNVKILSQGRLGVLAVLGFRRGAIASSAVSKRLLFEPFIYKNAHCTKTGSGQT